MTSPAPNTRPPISDRVFLHLLLQLQQLFMDAGGYSYYYLLNLWFAFIDRLFRVSSNHSVSDRVSSLPIQ